MKFKYLVAVALAAALTTSVAASAQVTSETKVSTSTGADANGAMVKKTKVETIHRHKTRHVKRILGVKVGHKTRVHKTVKETSTDANGNKSTTVKTVNK